LFVLKFFFFFLSLSRALRLAPICTRSFNDNAILKFSISLHESSRPPSDANNDGGDRDERTNAGAAYVFRRRVSSSSSSESGVVVTWEQEAELTAGDGKALDYFGSAVAVRGDFVLVGAPGADLPASSEEEEEEEEEEDEEEELMGNAGKVYFFRWETKDKASWHSSKKVWRQHQLLTAPDAAANDQFGSALALGHYGRTAVVGARADDDVSE
jgi:hypothetical protein